jgi:ABC-type transport system involved in cytochrome c biogenesis permease subunit
VLILNLDRPGIRFLLVSHVVLVTLGYSTTFLIGALGICFVGQRSFAGFPRGRMRALARATFALGVVAAIATIAAVVLGSVWANAAWGRYWGWDLKEVGGLAVILWQLTFLSAHWFVRRNEQVLVLISIFGNVVVAMAWFGTNLLLGTRGTPGWITLVMAVVVNCALFVAGLAPAGWLRRSKAV